MWKGRYMSWVSLEAAHVEPKLHLTIKTSTLYNNYATKKLLSWLNPFPSFYFSSNILGDSHLKCEEAITYAQLWCSSIVSTGTAMSCSVLSLSLPPSRWAICTKSNNHLSVNKVIWTPYTTVSQANQSILDCLKCRGKEHALYIRRIFQTFIG